MQSTDSGICPQCGRERGGEERICSLCGHLFEVSGQAPLAAPPERPSLAAFPTASPDAEVRRGERADGGQPAILGPRGSWWFLGGGLVLAPVFAFLPIVSIMGWFLSALVHEMGHSASGWLFGMPSIPRIRLDGNAVTTHEGQKLFLVALVGCALFAGAWHVPLKRLRPIALGAVVVLYPLLALTVAHEVLFLVGGHGAELAFAFLALWRACSGGFTSSPLERVLYAMLGWFLLGVNLGLTAGLMTDEAARVEYATNGCFGLTNDYIRIAQHLGVSLEAVALVMTLVGLCVLPGVLLLRSVYYRALNHPTG